MKRGCRIFAVIVVAAVIGAIVTILVLDRKYEFLFAAGRVPHDQLVSPDMGLRVSIQPEYAGDYLLNLLRQQQEVPDWAFARILPYEVAFVLEPKGDIIESTFYVNAQRFGPQLATYMRQANLASRISFVRWHGPDFAAKDRGILVMKGTLPTDAEARSLAASAWNTPAPATPLELEGGHFVEAVVDNRSGSGFITVLSLIGANGVPDEQLDRASYQELTHFIEEVRLTADVVNTNEIDLTLRLVCDPDSYKERVGTVDFLFPSLYAQIQELLAENYGAELEGSAGWQNNVMVGRYRLKDLDRLLGIPRQG